PVSSRAGARSYALADQPAIFSLLPPPFSLLPSPFSRTQRPATPRHLAATALFRACRHLGRRHRATEIESLHHRATLLHQEVRLRGRWGPHLKNRLAILSRAGARSYGLDDKPAIFSLLPSPFSLLPSPFSRTQRRAT